MLRKLAVLPGWSRDRLFLHVELSGWRGGLAQIFSLGVALLGIGLGTGASDFHIILNAMAYVFVLVALGVYAALWLALHANFIWRNLALLALLVPYTLIAILVLISPDLVYRISPTTTLAGLASAALLSWWLRGRALAAWSSMSFSRQSWS